MAKKTKRAKAKAIKRAKISSNATNARVQAESKKKQRKAVGGEK